MKARILAADCLNVLPTLDRASIAAVVSDPPYGMGWDTDSTRFSGGTVEAQAKRGVGRSTWGSVIADDEPFDPSPWLVFPCVTLWGSNHYAAHLPVGTTLIWIKRNDAAFGSFLSDAEVGWQKGGHGTYCHRRVGGTDGGEAERAHPTQKPLSLMSWCIERLKLPEGSTILDPYCGSGTTGVAALRLGHNFIGIEKDPEYARVAYERIRDDQPLLGHTVTFG